MALATYDAQLAIKQEEARLEKLRGPSHVQKYEHHGPKVKFEETQLYKNMVKTKDIEEELVSIRNLIRKRTDPSYEPDDDDFNVKPIREFNKKVDYYKLLEIDDFASVKDIKGAYKRLVLQYHPDKNRDKKPAELSKMQEDFEKVQEAYEILSDRATRRQYDRSKFDESRAKNQGMGGIWKDKDGAGDKDNFWSAWSAKKAERMNADGTVKKPKVLPKDTELRHIVKISLDKSFRGGLKILEVDRDRMQRSFGQARETVKTFHVSIAQGQPNGSEFRIEGEGNWKSLNNQPGDLVFEFKHKPHKYLKQVPPQPDGNLHLVKPLLVRAKPFDRVLAAWSFTFKGHVVILRFSNPLMALAPSKACTVNFTLPAEGLPIMGDAASRGSLTMNVKVQMDGDGLVATIGQVAGRDQLRRRQMRQFNHTPHVEVNMKSLSSNGLPVRKFAADTGRVGPHGDESGHPIDIPAVLFLWEAPPDHDVIAFTKAASSLGYQATRRRGRFMWGYHRGFAPLRLPEPVYVALRDDELEEDAEEKPKPKRVKRQYPAKARFLMRFGLVPEAGLNDPGSTDEEDEDTKEKKRGHLPTFQSLPSQRISLKADPKHRQLKPGEAAVALEAEEQEGEEERELTTLIREKMEEAKRVEQKFNFRKQKMNDTRDKDEGTLRELLENDKKREMARIEKEMSGLTSTYQYQVDAEKKWMTDFLKDNTWKHEWVCVFKPHMVCRKEPKEDAAVVRFIAFNDVVKVKDQPTDDNWVQLSDGSGWAKTWHQKHGTLLQKWFAGNQQKFLDLQEKIDGRRKIRNETFLVFKKKKQEVTAWCIPPGPSAEELREIEDDDGEQLHELLEPILKEVKDSKKRLKELRQKRLEAVATRAEQASGGIKADIENRLPKGFQLKQAEASAKPAPVPPAPQGQEIAGWEAKKKEATKAFSQKEWNTAIALYTQALEADDNLPAKEAATLLSNRSLTYAKLDDWKASLKDATEATERDGSWVKGWLRRVIAELRLQMHRDALNSLKRGLVIADSVTAQFLPFVTECEGALHADFDPSLGEPASAAERIERFRSQGNAAFEQSKFGLAVLYYTRALFHRSMMEQFVESSVLSNRAAAFLKLNLGNEALVDALASSEKHDKWAKPLIRAGQAALLLQDFKAAYTHFAKARRIEQINPGACEGVSDCLQKIVSWDYPAAIKRWSRFTMDRRKRRDDVRVWALSDVFFEEHGAPEWCKSLSSSFFRDDVLMLAGNVAGSLAKLKFGLTVLKSKFRRVFYVPGNADLWIRKQSLMEVLRGKDKIENEVQKFGDSVAKLLEVLHLCDELGVETAPAEVAEGVYVVPLFSWYSRDFVDKNTRRENATQSDADAKVTIDQWITWPFGCGSDDAFKFFMRMNEASLRTTLVAKADYEQFSDKKGIVLTMTHFLTRPELKFDWTVPGIWDHIGCIGLDEQVRAIGSNVHVYGRACKGGPVQEIDGVHYVHQYLGKADQHREGFAPFCAYDKGTLVPGVQPTQRNGNTFTPLERKPEPQRGSGFGGG